MQAKLLLTLLFITIVALIISSGCGGGSGTTQPSSLVTPTPNSSDNMAYITIKVKWPEQGKAGKLIMSSEDGKEITASMPPDAKKIELKIFNYKGKDESLPIDFTKTDDILAEGRLPEPDTQIQIPIPVPTQVPTNLNILPAIPVKVWAGCFSETDEVDPTYALSTSENYMILKVGNQTANLNLGNYELTIEVTQIPELPQGYKINPNLESSDDPGPTPTPAEVGGAGPEYFKIKAILMIVYPTPSPNPDGTTPPASTPKPVEGRHIQFTGKIPFQNTALRAILDRF
jgi:hypothetical protein